MVIYIYDECIITAFVRYNRKEMVEDQPIIIKKTLYNV